MSKANPYTIGIDATNLRAGGGVTHLMELLRAAQPAAYDIARIVVWGSKPTLKALDSQPWLSKRNPPALDKGLLRRTLWQRYRLSQAARDEGCDVLFVPGGSYAGNFHPVVTMSQNLLPFEMPELLRYRWTLFTLKWLLLRLTQSRSFRKADGVIFLTKYARDVVLRVTGKLHGQTRIVPHGLNPRFNRVPKLQRVIAEYDNAHPYRVLYVSIIDQYKHQWHVVEAVAALRKQGFSIVLDLVGPAFPPALKRLNQTIDRVDIGRRWVHYHGAVPFNELHLRYAQADLGLFASSCENMPNILLETMASGLPIACSNRGPMLEVLGQAGVFFNPEQPEGIARALRELIESPQTRTELATASYERVQEYSWLRCADETLGFLARIARESSARNNL
ncbi:glycosyltransferase family 4 protein [Burkholderiaceae bacterium]|nr:glycosyltransferase family 4 protein [Burkholderiaceae bacterium]